MPLLFLIFSKDMHLYLNRTLSRVHEMGSMGIAPILDYEFADDTTLYVQGTESNLQVVYDELNTFCLASGARLNWEKTVGFCESRLSIPLWKSHPGFKWIERVCQLNIWVVM